MNKDNRPECKGEREENLRPCPFCGAPPHDVAMTEGCDYYISCQCCGAMVMEEGSDSVIEAWNTRHTEQPEGWVSVEEEKPGYGELVLIYWLNIHGEPNISTGTLHSITRHCGENSPHDDKWYMAYSRSTNLNVTHWQPLQKPPEEG